MAGVYNSFEIKFDFKGFADRAKPIAEKLFHEIDYKVQDEFLLWDDLEALDGVLSGELSYSAGDDDLQKSREIFEELCKRIATEFTMAKFMAKHSYDYSNTDATEYMLCFREEKDLIIYQAEVVDDVGCMQTKRYTIGKKLLDFQVKEEYEYEDLFFGNEEDSDNDFMLVLEGYDYSKYPKKKKKTKSPAKETKKPKFEYGKYYKVKYRVYTKEKEVLGKYDSVFAKTHSFKLFGKPAFSDTEYIEDDDIKSFKEVFPTDETKKLIDSFDQIGEKLDNIEKEMTQLRNEFFLRYSTDGDGWERRPLKTVDISQSYPGVEKIEIGNTYLVKVKDNSSMIPKEKGIDAVLVVGRFEDAFGEQVRVMGADPDLYPYNTTNIRPVIAGNIDEFTDELILDEPGSEVQKKRIELYSKMNDFYAKRKQVIDDYHKSFTE